MGEDWRRDHYRKPHTRNFEATAVGRGHFCCFPASPAGFGISLGRAGNVDRIDVICGLRGLRQVLLPGLTIPLFLPISLKFI